MSLLKEAIMRKLAAGDFERAKNNADWDKLINEVERKSANKVPNQQAKAPRTPTTPKPKLKRFGKGKALLAAGLLGLGAVGVNAALQKNQKKKLQAKSPAFMKQASWAMRPNATQSFKKYTRNLLNKPKDWINRVKSDQSAVRYPMNRLKNQLMQSQQAQGGIRQQVNNVNGSRIVKF